VTSGEASRPDRRVALLTALTANVVIAAAKGAAALVTGSSGVFAEALHSVADSVNERRPILRD
jgi:divalent metal cation (Fe/Co/Zn/Cd) transporter